MAKPPEFKRILVEDLKTTKDPVPAWMDRLIYPLNNFLEQTYNLFNRNLDFTDNIVGNISTYTFTTPPTYNVGDFTTFSIGWQFTKRVSGVIMLQIQQDVSNPPVITQPTTISWALINNSTIRINYITGLANSTKYNATFLLI